jgi:hypothetical protein
MMMSLLDLKPHLKEIPYWSFYNSRIFILFSALLGDAY